MRMLLADPGAAAAAAATCSLVRLEQLVRHVRSLHAVAEEEVRRVRRAAGQDARPELAQPRLRPRAQSEAAEGGVGPVHEARHARRKGAERRMGCQWR